MKSPVSTWHIHITGLVQGIGFRPLIYRAALDHGIKGWVKNDNDGVHIELNGTSDIAHSFYESIISKPPPLARITDARISQIPFTNFQQFEIVHDTQAGQAKIDLTPDIATCECCRSELNNQKNRRYHYPFITCSVCGPRYSIIQDLPYDREHTSMDAFTMCDACQSEYKSPENRRYYAQTNSCPSCSIRLILYGSNREEPKVDGQFIIQFISEKWSQGKIVAIKGIGGYLITCCASNSRAIATLRTRKRRPDKPFALMYPGVDSLKAFNLSAEEQKAFTGPVSPIVLVSKSENNDITKGICDDLTRVGIMTPYAPLFQLLLEKYKGPIVATSGNISNTPIIFQDQEALTELFEIADYVVAHNREIVVPQDDSIVVFTPHFKTRIVLRRSRGLAPTYVNSKLTLGANSALAMGAYFKSTFAVQQAGNVYISQYLGDLGNYETERNYQHTLDHLTQLLDIHPKLIVVDLHPDYSSTIKGFQLAEDLDIPILKVQHHIAHFSALLGEHALMDSDEKILGVIWDGMGIGTDDNIWGSEFFTYIDYQFDCCAHLPYYHHLANDKMAKEPRLAALSLCHEMDGVHELLRPKFSDVEWNVYTQLLRNKNSVLTSSMGRLFDAVASLVGIADIQTYEGQAASLLQAKAEAHFNKYEINYHNSYFKTDNTDKFSVKELMKDVVADILELADVGLIAAKFHMTLLHWIEHIAKKEEVVKIGFSGGVFQNTLLIDLIEYHLMDKFELLFHQDLSSNDENISFGQLIYAEMASNRPKDSVN